MADKKISALTALTAANVAPATDVVPIVDTSATETKKVTAKDLVDGALNGGTANGVLYLNGSKAATSGSALVFDGTNLGIGTSSPGARLHSKSSLAENTRIEGTTARGGGNVYASFYDPAGRKGYFGYSGVDDSFNMVNEMNAYMSFGTNGIERMRLDSSGNLGIGTASPTVRFEVSTAGGAVAAGRFYSPSTTNGARLELADNNTNFNLRTIPAGGTTDLSFTRDGTSFEMLRLNYTGSVAAGRPSLATNATDGFLYVPTCAGVPTGVPTAITGMAPIVVNTTNNKLYFYSGGAWRDAGP